MSAQLAQRSTFMLYAAMALAVAAGLSALPPLDPLEVLREQGGAWGLLAALLHLGLAGLGLLACRRAFMRQGLTLLQGRRVCGVCAAAVLGAWAWWLGSWQFTEVADGRALLWLEMLPLWLWPAGLLHPGPAHERPGRHSAPAIRPFGRHPLQTLAYGFEDDALLEQVHMAGPRYRQSFTAGPQRALGREHDAVAGAEDAQHPGRL
ncbi:hypothetical protein [Ideonella sp. B508-1]|uniref:hypothetical protein n=1 Tax=Ideonella sp. B508-1 TaxID=137716 RepID=UPI0011D29791|nr:hypothetical protein [Ideonella sp. B508-1]